MTGAQPDFDLALPGAWWSIPLDDEATAARAIRRLVAETAGHRDEDARMRADLRRRFAAAAEQAMSAAASQLYLCREIVSGVMLPSSLTVYWPPLTLPPADPSSAPGTSAASGTTGAAASDLPPGLLALRRLLGPPEAEQTEEPFTVADTVGLRRDRLLTAPADPDAHDDPETAEITTVIVDYWLVLPEAPRPVLLSFACGMPLLRTQLIDLFDLVVATIRWR